MARLVIANTWAWPVGDDFHFVAFSRLMGGPLGRFLITRRNLFVNRVMPAAVGDRRCLTAEVMDHYRHAQPSPEARAASAALPGYIVGASDWLHTIWEERGKLAAKPALLLWGHRDIAFRKKELDRWRAALHGYELHEFPDRGHFLAEEAPDGVAALLRQFLSGDAGSDA